MTSSPPSAPNALPVLGSQTPRVFSAPPYAASTGPEAIDLARMAGLELDQWQQSHLTAALGESAPGKWAAREVGEVVPRQNGKNGELEARQLTGLFLLEEALQIHSAHMADTSVEQCLRLEALIEGTPELSRRVKSIKHGKGDESVHLHRNRKTGRAPRLRFRTRTGGGGRGFSCDTLYLDEAMIIPEAFHGTLMPVLSARPNPQLWYTGSAVDQEVHEHGLVLARVRIRGLKGDDPSLVYLEFSLAAENPDDVTEEMAADPLNWARANPALGIRIALENVESELRAMSPRTFAVERLGVGDWPRTDGLDGVVITPEEWAGLADEDSEALDPVCFAFDVTPDRSRAAIGAAGRRSDKLGHVEVIEHKRGTGWVIPRLLELKAHKPIAVVADGGSPAASLLPELEKAGIKVELISAKEHAQACGAFFDDVDQGTLRHLGTPELAAAIAGAVKRPLGDAWAWSRRNSSIDISPLVAITLASWGARTLARPKPSQVIDLNEVMQEMQDNDELTPILEV